MESKGPRWSRTDDKPIRSDSYWESAKCISKILEKHSAKEVKEILGMVASMYGMRVSSVFVPIGPPIPSGYRRVVGTPKAQPKARPDTAKAVPNTPSWKQTEKGKNLISRREEIISALKSDSIESATKERFLSELRLCEADIKVFKNAFRGTPPLGSPSGKAQ